MSKIFETRWITKYALSANIQQAEMSQYRAGGLWYAKDGVGREGFNEKECFATLEEARDNAEERRTKKIASLKKQIARLEKMEF